MANFSVTLQNPNLRLFFAGQGFANIGNMIKQIAIAWLAYRLTDSAFLLGVVMFSRELAAFLVAPFAGVIADRLNKYNLLILANLALLLNTSLLAFLVIGEHISVSSMILIQLGYGSISGVEIPTRQAFVNDLVLNKENLTNAIAFNSTLFNSARIVGPSVAGWLIPWIGEGGCFLVYGFFLGMILLIFSFIRYQKPIVELIRSTVRKELVEGVKYAYKNLSLRVILALAALVTFFGISYEMLLPVVVDEVFDKGPQVFGYLTSAIGGGSILGALLLANRRNLSGLESILQIGIWVFGLSIAAFAFTNNLYLAIPVLFVAGIGRVTFFTANNTLLQSLAEDAKRGRILSLYIMLFMGSKTLGNLFMGILADQYGVFLAILVSGLGCCISVLFLRNSILHVSDQIEKYNEALERPEEAESF